jgi:parvulin-like peptidyl-prolyl isomerase
MQDRDFDSQPLRRLVNEGLKALVFCFCLSSCFGPGHVIKNKTVLKVNQTEISAQDFADRLAQKLKDYDALQAKDEKVLKRAKEQTIQSFIYEVITRDFAAQSKIELSKAELEGEIARIRSRYPDDNAFRRSLADENVSLERWTRDLAFTILQRKVVSHLLQNAPPPSDAEMKAFFEENKKLFESPARIQLRQIVLEKEENAKRILDQISAGKAFAELAKKFSVAPEGENGGVTQWIEKGTLEVFDNAFKLPVGARSKIIKSPYGYHIYEVLKKEPEGRLSFEQAKGRIRTLITERMEQKIYSTWLEEQIRKATVFRNDPLLQAILVTTRGT